MGFSRQEYWSGLPFLSSEDPPDPGIEPMSLRSPALAGMFFTTSATWEAPSLKVHTVNPTALDSDQNLPSVSGRVLKKTPVDYFSCVVLLQCDLASSSQRGIWVNFFTFWNLDWTSDLVWQGECSRIDILRFNEPFQNAFAQKKTDLPCKEAQSSHVEREATRNKTDTLQSREESPH